MPVLRWCVPQTFQSGLMLTHCPARLNQDHCLSRSLTHSRCVSWYPEYQTHTGTQTLICRHTQGLFSTGTLGRGCHGDNNPTLLHHNPRASTTPLRQRKKERDIKKWYYSKCGMCERECAFPSSPTHGIPREDGRAQWDCRTSGPMEWDTQLPYTHYTLMPQLWVWKLCMTSWIKD